MSSIRLENLSPFGRLALTLDGDFSELARLSGLIERLKLESESDLDHAVQLLKRFSQHGQKIGQSMQEFSVSLQEAHRQSEVATQMVAERAQRVQERKQQRDQLQESLLRVEQEIKTTNASLTISRKAEGKDLSIEEKRQIRTKFERLNGQLADFIGAAQAVKEQSVALKFKRIERDSQSMLDTLQALRGKLQSILSRE